MESENLLYSHIEQETFPNKHLSPNLNTRGLNRKNGRKKGYVKRCWSCGREVIWQNDFMQSELGMVCMGDSSDKVVSFYTCPHCGYEYTMTSQK